MKTYRSITSLATSPAISNNSLYSNGFFVTITPTPPPNSSNNHNNNNDSNVNYSYSNGTTTTFTGINSAITPTLSKKLTATEKTITTTKTTSETMTLKPTTTPTNFENNDPFLSHIQHLHNGDEFFVLTNPISNKTLNDESHTQHLQHNDINILINNYDQKMFNYHKAQNYVDNDHDHNDVDDDDGDELSVENTRL